MHKHIEKLYQVGVIWCDFRKLTWSILVEDCNPSRITDVTFDGLKDFDFVVGLNGNYIYIFLLLLGSEEHSSIVLMLRRYQT